MHRLVIRELRYSVPEFPGISSLLSVRRPRRPRGLVFTVRGTGGRVTHAGMLNTRESNIGLVSLMIILSST